MDFGTVPLRNTAERCFADAIRDCAMTISINNPDSFTASQNTDIRILYNFALPSSLSIDTLGFPALATAYSTRYFTAAELRASYHVPVLRNDRSGIQEGRIASFFWRALKRVEFAQETVEERITEPSRKAWYGDRGEPPTAGLR